MSLHLIATLALRSALEELAAAPSSPGTPWQVHYGASKGLVDDIRAGARGDLAFLTDAGIESLQREGILRAGSRVDLARSEIAVAVRAGAPRPDISTVESFTSTLLRARSVAYSDIGASGLYLKSLLRRLGIAEQVDAKALVLPPGFTGERVVSGEVELALQQRSELMQVAGLDIIGPLPAAIQQTTVFSVGVFVAADPQADALVIHLRRPEVTSLLKRHGFS